MKPGDTGGDCVDQTDGEFERGPTDAVKGEFPQSRDKAADEEARNDRQKDALAGLMQIPEVRHLRA